jgi:hypothetical protein
MSVFSEEVPEAELHCETHAIIERNFTNDV